MGLSILEYTPDKYSPDGLGMHLAYSDGHWWYTLNRWRNQVAGNQLFSCQANANASPVGDCPISAGSSKLFLLLWWKYTDDIMMNLQMVNIPVYCSQDMKIMLLKI